MLIAPFKIRSCNDKDTWLARQFINVVIQAGGQYSRMDAWFPQVKTRILAYEEIKRYDPKNLAFLNLNTPEDFAQAEQRISE